MKINTHIVLKDLNGEPLRNKEVDVQGRIKETVDIVLGPWLAHALAYSKTDNQYQAWLLAKKFDKEKEIDLTSEEITFIKGVIKTANMAPIVGGQVIEILEGGK